MDKHQEVIETAKEDNKVFPFELVCRSGVSYAAAGVYITLLTCPWGIDDPDELVGRGLQRKAVEEALEELLGRGLIERRRL